jgi:hypothetical protein
MAASSLKPSLRFKIGTILVIVLAFNSGRLSFKINDIWIFLPRYREYGTIFSDHISQIEKQMSCLRSQLSPDERVGFVSSLEGDESTEAYFLAMYALAPTVVSRAITQGKLIAVYPGEQGLDQAQADGYLILFDCNDGIGLVMPAGTK